MTVMTKIAVTVFALLSAAGCRQPVTDPPADPAVTSGGVGTCTGTFASYWQDPASAFAPMWAGQVVSNTPPPGWTGPVFRLSDAYPREPVDESAAQPWRDARFDPLFASGMSLAARTALAEEYAWAVMRYIQAGNIESGSVETDWTLCNNPVRGWYHIPFQTYDVLSGREFTHGLTREAPVRFNVRDPDHPAASVTLSSTMWAVGFFNPTAAHTLGTVWQADGTAILPTDNVRFDEGAVVGKLLFSTLSPGQLPFLEHMPAWTANISEPGFCTCTGQDGASCTMREQSEQCPRSTRLWAPLHLVQFDIAIRDGRAAGTGWVFGTFVADGQRKAGESNPWNRISPLGLMWGNDPPPAGQYAHAYPADPRQNGFAEEVIFWDVVDMLNAVGGDVLPMRPGHLGCNSRLNGPADNANSSCMSCHMTASVPDAMGRVPPIIAQFQPPPGVTSECVTPSASRPNTGVDASGSSTTVKNGVPFASSDRIFFFNTPAGAPIDMTAQTPSGRVNVLGDWPQYADGRTSWIPLDYSLQLSISLVQWLEWQKNQQENPPSFDATLPGR